jgi:negative regulator of sigma E activity
MDNQATPIEQVMFTEVEFIGPNPSATAAASASPAGLSARSSAVAQLETPALGASTAQAPAPAQAQASPSARLDISPWRLSSLPEGFRLVAADPAIAVDGGERRGLMISDGLSTVSVYIEPDRGRGLAGQEQVGAVHAAGRVIGGQQVTVVGEAPALTVDAIADALSLGD